MCFKHAWALLCTAALGLGLLTGCNLHINEKPPVVANYDFKPGEKLGCLSKALPVMSGFMDGSAAMADVEGMWDCFGVALKLYGDFVRGQDSNRYQAREMATFFQKYFLGGLPI